MEAQAQGLYARAKMLVNNDLKRICKEEGRIQSGNKAQLQERVISILSEAVQNRDMATLDRMRYRIHNHGQAPPSSASTTTPATSNPPVPAATHTSAWLQQPTLFAGSSNLPKMRPSPFYELLETIIPVIVLDSSPSHRQSVIRTLKLSADLGFRLRQDPSLRLMLYAHTENALLPYAINDVAFPQQFEVKINNDEVRANYKGLKNKPGSTRPADLTDYVRKSPANYPNSVQITYALTQNRYHLYICLVKKSTSQQLAREIQNRRVITKDKVLEEMRRKANDPDIVVGSINMSLKDPVSTLRITIPCRGTLCNHTQCFDAESFLQLQEQAPTWICPICSKTLSFEALAVDKYVQEILQAVPEGTDQVTIEPDGQWSYGNAAENGTPQRNGSTYDDSDDDLIEVTDQRLAAVKTEAVTTPLMTRTPPLSSREASSAPRTGSKRKSEVIDLTLSDDDEEPVRPVKKVNNTFPDPRRYQTPTVVNPGNHVNPYSSSRSLPTLPHPRSSMSVNGGVSTPTLPNPNPMDQSIYGSSYAPSGAYLPPPRHSYQGNGTSYHPTYLDSSP